MKVLGYGGNEMAETVIVQLEQAEYESLSRLQAAVNHQDWRVVRMEGRTVDGHNLTGAFTAINEWVTMNLKVDALRRKLDEFARVLGATHDD